MSGTLAIPVVFATQADKTDPVANLDTNLSTIATYVNAREITQGVLANRPAAGTAGALYLATNVNGGTLYADNGATWVQVAGGVSTSSGTPQILNLVGQNDAGTPNTLFGYSADLVALRSPSDGTVVVRTNTGTLTNTTSTAGSVANGRDQAAAFGASNFIHFYFIWNGTTLATLSSLTAPPTGPVLPTGYTHWAYAGSVYYNATPLLVKTRWRGTWATYEVAQNALAAGVSATEAAVSTTTLVPANALMVNIDAQAPWSNNARFRIRIITGVEWLDATNSSGGASYMWRGAIMPNIAQNFYYLTSANALKVDVLGYSMPNGGE